MEWILAIAVSFAVGAISVVFGVGGGFILVPVLHAILGVEIPIAVGSTACYVLGPATTSMLYRKTRVMDWRLPLTVSGGLFVGVLLGTSFHNSLKVATSSQINVETVVLGTYVVLLTTLGLFSIWESERSARFRPVRRGWMKAVLIPPVVTFREWDEQPMSLTILAWFGVAVGFLSGLLGISGGLLVVPGFLYLFGLPAQPTVATSMILVWIVSMLSTTFHAWTGNVDLGLVIALLAGGTVGARIGSSIGQRLKSQELRRNFGVLALLTAVFVAFQLAMK